MNVRGLLCGLMIVALAILSQVALAAESSDANPAVAAKTTADKGAAEISAADLQTVRAVEAARVSVIEKVYGSVVAIYGNDRQGGGSGVLFSREGYALTNFHVVRAAGEEGWAGLADGQLYRWKLYGVDPGGDVAIIRLTGKDAFPPAELGDSRTVRVGDWAMAMGNPFVLAEDQRPTVTLGIVSAIQRFQPGEGGKNALVYGNCIQVDSSINPGNSGGPLFNMLGQCVGINGRGSFEERGRVNVGVGYAISMEQIKNFIPDLLATKTAQHGTLDAVFTDRQEGVICSQINLNGKAAKLGLDLADRLISFAGEKIRNSNHYLNLVSTLPAKWPVEVVFERDKQIKTIWLRLDALPYSMPKPPTPKPKDGGEKKPDEQPPKEAKKIEPEKSDGKPQPAEEKKIAEKKSDEQKPDGNTPADKPADDKPQPPKVVQRGPAMPPLEPGKIRDAKLNREQAERVLRQWQKTVNIQANSFAEDQRLSWSELWIDDSSDAGDRQFRGRFVALDNGKFAAETAQANKDDRSAPTVVRAALAALYSARPEAAFNTLRIEASDRTQGQRAYRLFGELQDGTELYLWFSVLGSRGEFRTQWLKVAADDDDRLGYAIESFSREANIGFAFPHQFTPVRNLSETRGPASTLSDFRFEPTAAKSSESPAKNDADSK